MLIEMLKIDKGGMHEVRGAAAIAIGLIGDGTAVDPLLEIVNDDPVTSNKAFAIAALGCLIDKDSVPRMPQLFENIHYRQRCPVVQDVMRNL
jgi:HEAT repeat protein